MKISRERLLETAGTTGFRPEILEKVIQLLHLLQSLQEHPQLNGKLSLKGGTALNLFYFDAPRLSVDIERRSHQDVKEANSSTELTKRGPGS